MCGSVRWRWSISSSSLPSLTVYENIASPLRVQGKPRAEIEIRVQEAQSSCVGALFESHAAAIVRRPAAAHRDCAGAG